MLKVVQKVVVELEPLLRVSLALGVLKLKKKRMRNRMANTKFKTTTTRPIPTTSAKRRDV